MCTITPITSHASVCGGDENEKKKGQGGKKDPDCESPGGMKRRVGRSCFALSDRSRGLPRQWLDSPAIPPSHFPPLLVGKNDERKVVRALSGWTEYIYSR